MRNLCTKFGCNRGKTLDLYKHCEKRIYSIDFPVVNNELRAGLEDGRVVQLEDAVKGAKISNVAKLGNACGISYFWQKY